MNKAEAEAIMDIAQGIIDLMNAIILQEEKAENGQHDIEEGKQ